MTNAKYRTPSQQRSRVKSQTQSRSGASALKSRSTRSAGRMAFGSGIVVRHGLPRRLAPWMPCLAHQPLDLAARDVLAGPQQRLPHPAVAVGLEVGLVGLADARQQPLVLELAG